MNALYRPYRDLLREIFPAQSRVRKVPLNGGMTCPNLDGSRGRGGCSYCDNRSFSPVWNQASLGVAAQLREGAEALLSRHPGVGILAYFQPFTNTYAPVEQLRRIYAPALEHPAVVGLAIGTRPDCLPPPVVELLAELSSIKPIIVEIGMQTASDSTLERIGRGHTVAELVDAARRCRQAGLRLATHVIVGLPGEGLDDFLRTARLVGELGFGSVKIHPLHVVRGTRLAEEYGRGEFQLLEFQAYCEAVAAMIASMPREVAIERFSGESPSELLVGPAWSGDRSLIVREVERLLQAGREIASL